jgi:hypothetical protein
MGKPKRRTTANVRQVPHALLEQAKDKAIRTTKEGEAMKTAVVYCRVSTDYQEREGTSLSSGTS